VINAYNSVDEFIWILLEEGAEIKSHTDDPGHQLMLISSAEMRGATRHFDRTVRKISSAISELDRYEPLVRR
jgi:hypothetical protein